MVEKLNCWEYEEGGKELKVLYHASAAAAYDGNLPYYNGNMPYYKGNLPYIITTCLYS